MATAQASMILRHIRDLAARDSQPSDGELLRRFSAGRDAAAFEALVRRHGAMVLGVCRRVLGNAHDAEDAFQATFLTLARSASSVGRGALGAWLYRVAHRNALRARAGAAARAAHEKGAGGRRAGDPLEEVTGRELLAVLDEELRALPERHRAPLVLCYLQGQTRDEAARQMGLSLRTLKRRLEEGRDRLRGRLARRGLGLSAALLAVGVAHGRALSAPLVGDTVRAAVGATAPLPARGVLRSLAAGKARGASVVALSLLVAGAGLLARPAADRSAPVVAPVAAQRSRAAEKKAISIDVRVVDADDKPVEGAEVALVGIWLPPRKGQAYRDEVVARGKTDRDGKQRLAVKASWDQFHWLHLLAGAKGYAVAWRGASTSADRAELRLVPEQVVRGRLIDVQGQPAAKVRARVLRVVPPSNRRDPFGPLMARQAGYEFPESLSRKVWPFWPEAVLTDDKGRFTLNGFGSGQEVDLLVEDDRFASQELVIEVGGKEQSVVLAGPQRLEGRVVFEDTKEPAAGAWLNASCFRSEREEALARLRRRSRNTVVGRTDDKGRFRVNLYPGETVGVSAFAPEGKPYLGVRRDLGWPKAATRQEVEIALPRGVAVKGKITEAPSGKPIDQAEVYYVPQTENNPGRRGGLLVGPYYKWHSKADGTFDAVVPVGKGHLIVTGPGEDFLYRTVGSEELAAGRPGGEPRHHHGVIAVEANASDRVKEVSVALRRGVTIRGRVVGPDGKPVRMAGMVCSGELVPSRNDVRFAGVPSEISHQLVMLQDGAFELPNCDPDRTYRVSFFDMEGGGGAMSIEAAAMPRRVGRFAGMFDASRSKFGAAVELSAKKAGGKPVTVTLRPSGKALVRLVDGKGKPVRPYASLELVARPGPSLKKAVGRKVLAAESAGLPGHVVQPDAEGRLTFTGLIPGATYRLKAYTGEFGLFEIAAERDFTAESGKELKLDDLVVPPSE